MKRGIGFGTFLLALLETSRQKYPGDEAAQQRYVGRVAREQLDTRPLPVEREPGSDDE